jgi:hypothetical protein
MTSSMFLPTDDITERDRLVSTVFKFDVDFPDEFRKIERLFAQVSVPVEDAVLRYELGRIVYRLQERYRDPQYGINISKLEKQTATAALALREARKSFELLDFVHLKLFESVLSTVPHDSTLNSTEIFSGAKAAAILDEMDKMAMKMEFITVAISFIAIFERKKPLRRSRPRLPYRMPTWHLVNLWKTLTGQQVVTPKGTSPRGENVEAIQPSTEFVRLALKMIDPNVTTANVFTSIRTVLAAEKKMSLMRSTRTRNFWRELLDSPIASKE